MYCNKHDIISLFLFYHCGQCRLCPEGREYSKLLIFENFRRYIIDPYQGCLTPLSTFSSFSTQRPTPLPMLCMKTQHLYPHPTQNNHADNIKRISIAQRTTSDPFRRSCNVHDNCGQCRGNSMQLVQFAGQLVKTHAALQAICANVVKQLDLTIYVIHQYKIPDLQVNCGRT